MAQDPYVDFIDGASGASVQALINKIGGTNDIAFKRISAIANVAAEVEIGYFVDNAIVYADNEEKFYYYNGSAWVLHIALNGGNFVLKAGDTMTGDLGVPGLQLDIASPSAGAEGKLIWNATDGVPEIGMPGGSVNQQIGLEMFVPRGKAIGSDIDNSELVYVSGASGSRPELTLAKADAEATACGTIAMATEDILQNQNGYYTAFGLVRDIPVPTATYSDGEELYLSASVAGGFTNVKPSDPNYCIKIGYVILAHDSAGIIFINILQITNKAEYVKVTDSGGYYNGTEVETVLQEIGAGTAPPVIRSEWLQNGFVDASEVSLDWDDGSRTLTIDSVGANFRYYYDGVLYTETGALTETITDTEGMWVIYIDGEGSLTSVNNPSHSQIDSVIENETIICYVYWDATNNDGRMMYELHGHRMSPATHHWIHDNIGSSYSSGMALADFVIDDSGADAEDAQFSIASGNFYDEDLEQELDAIAKTVGAEIWYLNSSDWRWTTNSGYSVLTTGTGRLAYNNSGAQTEVGNNNFVLCHIFATNIVNDSGASPKYIAIQGQDEYATIISARNGAEEEINDLMFGSLPLEEIMPVGTVIFQTSNGYANAVKGRTRTTDAGDNYVDWRSSNLKTTGGSVADHGSLAGLSDNDHPQYLLVVNETKEFGLAPFESDASVTVADGKVGISIPASMNGMDIVDALASVHTKGITDTTDIQVRRRRAGSDVDVLSTLITIGNEWFASDGVINTSNDDLATGDMIFIDIDDIHSGTAPLGLSVVITASLP